MDLRQLEMFVRVAERGSYTRASIELNIAQPALSRLIRALEIELGNSVFHRNGRGVTLTEAGKVLLEHARGILHQVTRAREEVGKVRGALTGRVALGLPPTQARLLSVPLMAAFTKKLPAAQLSISEGLSSGLRELVHQGRLDVALIYNPPNESGVVASLLVSEPLYLVTNAREIEPKRFKKSVSLVQLAQTPLIIPTRPNAIRMLVESTLAAHGLYPKLKMEMDAVSAILELVADGAGAAVLPRASVTTFGSPKRLALTPILTATRAPLGIDLYIATSAHRPSSLALDGVIEIMRTLVPKRLAM